MSATQSLAERFRGSMPALVTPFKNGDVDEDALKQLIEWQIAEGSHGIVPVGTTGESPTLTHEEHERVIALTVETVAGRVPVMAGAGSNNTTEAIRFMKHAADVGADAALVVTPYYNKPTQRMLYAHYKALHDAADLPIFIYNIPGRSVVDMTTETMTELFKLPRIVGIKDAGGDVGKVALQRQAMGPEFIQFSAEDPTAVGYNAMGGVGCVSVTANVAPAACAKLQEACLAGNYAEALEWQDKLLPLHTAVFIESSPAPTKYALSLLGKCAEDVRMPICPVTDESKAVIKAAMVHAGVLT